MRASLHAVLADKARGQKRNRPLDRGHLQPTASAQLSRNVGPYGLRAATAGTVQCSITKLSTKPGQLHQGTTGEEMAALPLIATKLAFPRAGAPFTFTVTPLCWDCRPLQPVLSLLRRSLSY